MRDDAGADVGWWDLATDEAHPTSPDLAQTLADAVAGWRAGIDSPMPQESAASISLSPGPHLSESTMPTRPHPKADAEAGSGKTPDLPPHLDAVDGVAGASAARQFQRRHDARQERVITNHPKIGKFLLAAVDDPQSTRAWSTGAAGEASLGAMLGEMAGANLRVLHDRRIPKTSANIDHLVICPSGVYVVDAKHYPGAGPELRVDGGILRPRTELLIVGRRDRTHLVDGMHKQLDLVRAALSDAPEVPIHGVLCFIGADWPLIGGAFTVRGVAVMWPKKLKALLATAGDLDADSIADLQLRLHEAFPRAKS
ncbi:nuclease-related domain-containing protein [Propioniciclava tarda]|uniref:NERD domain-containing protein n=1 Tax=Propioniciclava tarda TaxID=433330 RepID=A0A4V6MV40_PROTD|nr:nuclease-related domain-containing protein [Propioniciclava tarda]TBT93098.1 NERD domain-containing protein [Propioniciclava tarda]SMO80535.1 Nuclease-related domain-containing protein [Propioniciclava tarda]